MKKLLLTALSALAIGLVPAGAQWGQREIPEPTDGLKDAYKDYFKIGVAVNNHNVPRNPRRGYSAGRMPTASRTSAARTRSRCAAIR